MSKVLQASTTLWKNKGFEKDKWDIELRKHPSSDHPKLLIIAGPSRVGKTTFIKWLRGDQELVAKGFPEAFPVGKYLDKDAILINPKLVMRYAKNIPSSDEDRDDQESERRQGGTGTAYLSHPEKDPKYKKYFTAKRNEMVLQALEEGKSVILDDHCDDVARKPDEDDAEDKNTIRDLLVAVKALPTRKRAAPVSTAAIGLILDKDEYQKRLTTHYARIFGLLDDEVGHVIEAGIETWEQQSAAGAADTKDSQSVQNPPAEKVEPKIKWEEVTPHILDNREIYADYLFTLNVARGFFPNINELARTVDHTLVLEPNTGKPTEVENYKPNVIAHFKMNELGHRCETVSQDRAAFERCRNIVDFEPLNISRPETPGSDAGRYLRGYHPKPYGELARERDEKPGKPWDKF